MAKKPAKAKAATKKTVPAKKAAKSKAEGIVSDTDGVATAKPKAAVKKAAKKVAVKKIAKTKPETEE